MSIRAKLMAAIAAGMVALALATGGLVRAAGQKSVALAAEEAIGAAAQAFAAMERADVEKLDATLRALSGYPALVDAFAARDRARLLAVAAPLFAGLRENHDITHMYFLEPEPSRKVFLRVHRPEQLGDVVHRATLTRAIDTLAIGAGKELGQNAFALRVVRPWYGRDGGLVGYVELAEEIDHFVARMRQQTGDDYALLVEKVFLDRQAWARSRAGKRNNWDDRPRSVVVNSTIPEEAIVGFDGDVSSIPDRGLFLEEAERDGRVFVRGIVAVKDAAGRRVGGLFVLHEITQLEASLGETLRRLYLVLAGLTALLGALLLALVKSVVFHRLDRLKKELEVISGRFAVGDLEVRLPKATGRDEVGQYEEALGAFVQRVVGLLKDPAGRTKRG